MNPIFLSSLTAALPSNQLSLAAFKPTYLEQVNGLLDAAFGADRRKKSSYKLRETCQDIPDLSHVILHNNPNKPNTIAATIAFWQMDVGGSKALLLGPLAVHDDFRGQGLGQYLMAATIAKAIDKAAASNWQFIILIGDLDYYAKIGFQRVPAGTLDYPQPTDPKRILYLDIASNGLQNLMLQTKLPMLLNEPNS